MIMKSRVQVNRRAFELAIEARGFDTASLAEKAGIAFSTVARLVKGQVANLSTLRKLASALSVPIETLISGGMPKQQGGDSTLSVQVIGEKLELYRRRRKLTTVDLSQMCGISCETIRIAENDGRVKRSTLARIANVLHVQIDELMVVEKEENILVKHHAIKEDTSGYAIPNSPLIKYHRKLLCMTQATLAESVNVKPPEISHVENYSPKPIILLYRIAMVLEIPREKIILEFINRF